MDNQVRDSRSPVPGCTISISPGTLDRYFPDCDNSLKPCVGKQFATLEEGIKFYNDYAKACGFDARRGSQRTTRDGFITKKWVLCNREGEKNAAPVDNVKMPSVGDFVDESGSPDDPKKKRRRVSARLGCMARMVLNYEKYLYIVEEFTEYHTHALVPLVNRQFLDAERELNPGHQSFILNCARANIGPMKSFRLFKEVAGGYSNVGCTSVDFKNFSRDLKAYAIGVDAQMLLDKFFKKKERNPGFFFEYDVNENDQLSRLFWADHNCRRNYACFGDVVSFDATYSTNRYNMVFTPFTGKDNHGKCIIFGAALLAKEDVESYTWVFERFKSCMVHSPLMIITDQDPAIKIAMPRVFPGVKRRLCMWHIMQKLPKKLPRLKDDEIFRNKLKSIVWTSKLEPKEFEESWEKLMSDYGLGGNKWLNKIYEIRKDWIPAYFRDSPMSGLFRTTSMSESENSFFDKHLNPRSNLVEFSMLYDGAVDHQREQYDKLNNKDILSIPLTKTPILFETHAAKIYTTKIFNSVQQDIISAIYDFNIVSITGESGHRTYEISGNESTTYKVLHNEVDDEVTCSCNKFTMFGLPCQHIFWRFKEMKLEAIPDKYILGRWTKLSALKPIHKIDDNVLIECARNDKRKSVMNKLFSEFYTCLGLIEGEDEKMSMFLSVIKEQKILLTDVDDENVGTLTKAKLIEKYYGSAVPDKVFVFSPPQISTKGSGSRLISRQQAEIVRKNKPTRTCGRCGEKGHHDARNCPTLQEDDQADSGSE